MSRRDVIGKEARRNDQNRTQVDMSGIDSIRTEKNRKENFYE